MDLKHLHTFLSVYEIRNFTKAAEVLHYAQSNVTTQIQQLEKELDTRLFERIGKKVIPTQDAMDLVPYARTMLHTAEDIRTRFSSDHHNTLTIGASQSICIYRLPPIIQAFHEKRPDVELYLNVVDTADFSAMLCENTIDIAFALGEGQQDQNLKSACMVNETIGLFAQPDHILSRQEKVTIEDIAKQRLILTGKNCCYRRMLEHDLKQTAKTPDIVLETSSLEVIKQSVLSGLGICLLPHMAVQKELERKELVQVNCDFNYKTVSQLLYHKDKWMTQSLLDFIEIVNDSMKLDE